MGKDSLFTELVSCCLKKHVESQDGAVEATGVFEFPETYCGFRGHFPGQPVLPAIVQLAMVRYVAEFSLGEVLFPKGYERIKFRGMIFPGEKVMARVDLQRQESLWRGTFSLARMDGELVSSGNVVFDSNISEK